MPSCFGSAKKACAGSPKVRPTSGPGVPTFSTSALLKTWNPDHRDRTILGRLQDSRDALQQAVSEAERVGDQRGVAEALLLLGTSQLEQGLIEEALSFYRRSFAIAHQLGSKELSLAAVRQLSLLAQRSGNAEQAYQLAQMVMQIAQFLKDPNSLAGAFDQLGNVLLSQSDLRGAEQAYLAAIRYEEQLSHRSDLAFTLLRLGRVYQEMGAASQAEQVLRQAAMLFREDGSEAGERQAREVLKRLGVNDP